MQPDEGGVARVDLLRLGRLATAEGRQAGSGDHVPLADELEAVVIVHLGDVGTELGRVTPTDDHVVAELAVTVDRQHGGPAFGSSPRRVTGQQEVHRHRVESIGRQEPFLAYVIVEGDDPFEHRVPRRGRARWPGQPSQCLGDRRLRRGELPVGGGLSQSGVHPLMVVESYLRPAGWYVRAFAEYGGAGTLTAYVVCAQPHTEITVQ